MKSKKTRGIVLLAVGTVVVIVSVAADYIGIGGWSGFGYKQIVGSVLGIGMIVLGLALTPKSVKILK